MSTGNRDASFNPSEFRANFKQIIAKRSDLIRRRGGRMVTPGSSTLYNAGTVLGIVTASGLFAPYASGNSDGSQVPVGVLEADTYVNQYADSDSEIVCIHGAELLKDLLVGLDSNAITLLGGTSYVEKGVNIFAFWK